MASYCVYGFAEGRSTLLQLSFLVRLQVCSGGCTCMQIIGTRHKEMAQTGGGGALPSRRHTTDKLHRVPEPDLRSGPHRRYLVIAVQHLANISQGILLSGETTVTAAHYSDKAAHRKAIMGEEVPEPWTFQPISASSSESRASAPPGAWPQTGCLGHSCATLQGRTPGFRKLRASSKRRGDRRTVRWKVAMAMRGSNGVLEPKC